MSTLCSNADAELIEAALTEDQVISLIKTIKNLNQLDFLLKIQQYRITSTKSAKLDIPIDFIYENNYENINLQIEIFNKILHISKDPQTYLFSGAKWLVDNLEENQLLLEKRLKLLNCLFEYSQNDSRFVEELNLLELEKILLILKNSPPKNVYNYILSTFLPNYLSIVFSTERHKLLFQFIKSSGNIEILCSIYKKLISTKVQDHSNKFNLILEKDYWELLMSSITNGNNSISQKQALFLLSKSVEFECTNEDLLPTCIQYSLPNHEMSKIWKNYFVLIDVSNEKQLYLIQPSLSMFDSLIPLHYKWKLCLYKIFLKHSQNFVVFYTATYVLQLKWNEFSEIISEFLSAINKHEFSQVSQQTFQELHKFVQILENNQFLFILEKTLELTWTPVAVWRFYGSILHDKTNFFVPVQLLEQILNKLKLLPNTFIRNGCIQLVLHYFVSNFKNDEHNALIKVSLVLLENDKGLFEKFVKQNENSYFDIIEANDFMNLLRENCYCWIEICKLLGITKITNRPENYEEITDAFLAVFCSDFKPSLVEDYILSRIEKIENYENINNFTILAQENCWPEILEKLCKILLEDSSTQQQQIVAFSVINKNFNNSCLPAIDKWKYKFYDVSFKFDERIVKNYLDLYFKVYLDKDNMNLELVKEAIVVFQDILAKYTNLLPIILERISFFIKIEDSFAQRFVSFCLAEFFELDRNYEFKETTMRVLENIYQDEHFNNLRIAENMVLFTDKILEISTTSLLPLIVSKAICDYVRKSHLHGHEFINVLPRLILHGSLVHKNERIDYCIYQEIGNKFQDDKSPNFEEISVRFFALDSMLSIVRKNNQNADAFAEIFMKIYMENFNKRYFPHSHLHLQKLRIFQALILLRPYLSIQKEKLISLLAESFTTESHQTSVIHLMQWLYIDLIKDDQNGFKFIGENLKAINATRPSTLIAFIPILYQYTLHQNEKIWRETVNVLLPCTMGAQFKLRVYSQLALVKLYEQAKTRNLKNFLNEYNFLYNSLKQTLDASAESLKGFNLTVDFLDYFSLENLNFSNIYYVIPQMTGVMESEYENLPNFHRHYPFLKTDFEWIVKNKRHINLLDEIDYKYNDNIQRKITPWRNHFEEDNTVLDNNHLILVTSLVEKATNLGGLSRTCEVFGVKKLVMKTSKITSDKEFKSLSMSSENWLDIMEVKIDDLKQFFEESKRKGYCLIGAEQTSESVALQDFKFPKMTVLMLGNEKEGISPDLIPLLDYCVEIPQAGLVRSLNVHVAGAIIIWEYFKQHLV